MLTVPAVSVSQNPALITSWGALPLQFDLSPLGLGIVFVLVCILFATVSLILIYHWRRFPYDQEVFDRVEIVYLVVSAILIAVSVVAILAS